MALDQNLWLVLHFFSACLNRRHLTGFAGFCHVFCLLFHEHSLLVHGFDKTAPYFFTWSSMANNAATTWLQCPKDDARHGSQEAWITAPLITDNQRQNNNNIARKFILHGRPDVSSQKVMFVVHVIHYVMGKPRVNIFPSIFHGLISHMPRSFLSIIAVDGILDRF